MTGNHSLSYSKTNAIAHAFLVVQVAAILLYLFEREVSTFTGTIIGTTPHADSKSVPAVALILILISMTWFFLRRYKTPNPTDYSIKYPLALHWLLLAMEVSYFFFLGGLEGDVVTRREMISTGEANVGLWKISTLFLYLSTALLFAKLGMPNVPERRRRFGGRKVLVLTGLVTIGVFLLKDLQTGSRGSLLNVLILSLGGFSFATTVTARRVGLWLVRYGWIILAGISWGFLELTSFRAGGVVGPGIMSIILYDTILVKFSGNLAVVHDYLINDLLVRAYVAGIRTSEWMPIWNLGWFDRDISNWDFYPTIKSVVLKYFLTELNYLPVSLHYSEYGEYPFNSASYLVRLLPLGLVGIVAFFCALYALRRVGGRRISLRFGVYIYMFYFAVTSFTGFSLIEIPFILLPIVAVFFSSCFYYRTSENIVPATRVAGSTSLLATYSPAHS